MGGYLNEKFAFKRRMLIFAAERDGDTEIYSINLETGEETRLYNSGIEEGVP
jgi:Tol biopolymer transport system component